MKRFLSFGIVGAIGFCVDAGVLTALVATDVAGPIAARFFSFPLAVFVTWLLNRAFVFGSRSKGPLSEYARYFAVQVLGAATNLLVYLSALATFPALRAWPVVPLAAGAVVALFVNFHGARTWAFAAARTK